MSGENTKAIDRSDERVRHDDSAAGVVRAFYDRVRSGDLGMLPVAVGLVVISVVFTSLNPLFLEPNNLVNLLFDCATVGVISLGIVCVLMLGEIDLSVGSMSGLASAIVGVAWVNMGLPLPLAILMAVAAGALVGAVYAILLNWIGMPSFVSTLAGLLGTIIGLIEAFTAVSNADLADKAELLSASISVGMNCTAFGLMVAIPLVLVHSMLQSKTSKIVMGIEMASVKFLNALTDRAVHQKTALGAGAAEAFVSQNPAPQPA